MTAVADDGAPAGAAVEVEPDRRTHLQRRLAQLLLLVFIADVVVLFGVSIAAWQLRAGLDERFAVPARPGQLQPSLGPWLVLLWALVLVAGGAYDRREFGTRFEDFRRIVLASVVSLGLVGFIAFLTDSPLSRGYVLLLFGIGAPTLLLVRYAERKAFHLARRRGRLVNRTIAVGSAAAVGELEAVLRRAPWTGYHLLGRVAPVGDSAGDLAVLGTVEELPALITARDADSVLVAGGSYASAAELRRLGWALEGLDVDMLVVPALTDVAGPRVHFTHVAGLPLVHVREPQVGEAMGVVKRLFDVTVSGMLLLLLAPVMAAVALGVKLQDGGPVLYRQRRVGHDQAAFGMLKFRSMVVGADRLRADLDSANELDGVLFKIRDDPRVTRFGAFLRKYSLDELPQLFNVLSGEMSLVGPRPPLPAEVDRYDGDVHRRLLVRPGMTGLWQVSGRSDLSWEESVRLDLYYVDNWSLTGDLVILLKTVRAVLGNSGAY
jgi:exopolysaccharide biosynthesis polyprenyl glycosylphosphotransferase